MANVIIFGTGQIAELAHYFLTHDSPHDVAGFTLDAEYKDRNSFKDLPVVAFEEVEQHFPPDTYHMFIPISYARVNKARAERYLEAKRKGYSFVSYMHSSCIHANTPIGENCFIFENNVFEPFSEVGDNVIIWACNVIGHHTKIKDHSFIGSQAVIGGGTVVEEYAVVGIHGTTRDGITIGKGTILGAGGRMLKDTGEWEIYSDGSSPKFDKRSDELKKI